MDQRGSLLIGLGIFVLALGGLVGVDVLGWVVSTSVGTDPGSALGTVAKSYAGLDGAGALVITYLALLVVLSRRCGRMSAATTRSTSSPAPWRARAFPAATASCCSPAGYRSRWCRRRPPSMHR
jgi:hypothetical protein